MERRVCRRLPYSHDCSYSFVEAAPIPDAFGNLTKLTWLSNAYSNRIGSIPSSIGALSALQLVAFPGNSLKGSFPTVLTPLGSTLKEIYLFENNFTGPISRDQWALMGNLTIARIEENQFTGTLPDDIGRLYSTNPKLFSIGRNSFRGTLPSSMSQFPPNLFILDVSGNQFTGIIPANLSASTLLLRRNNFTGTVPESTCMNVQEIVYDCNRSLVCSCNCICGIDYVHPF